MQNYWSGSWFLVWGLAAFQRAGLTASRKSQGWHCSENLGANGQPLKTSLTPVSIHVTSLLEFSQVIILFRPQALIKIHLPVTGC